jgi:hypothetical protein
VKVPGLRAGLWLPERYRCRPYEIWFPVSWGSLPRSTGEVAVALSFSKIRKKSGGATEAAVVTQELIGRVRPSLRQLRVGQPPSGAFIKHHRPEEYCPPEGEESGIFVDVFALPRHHHVRKFEDVDASRIEALRELAIGVGSLPLAYGGLSGPRR